MVQRGRDVLRSLRRAKGHRRVSITFQVDPITLKIPKTATDLTETPLACIFFWQRIRFYSFKFNSSRDYLKKGKRVAKHARTDFVHKC